MPGEHRKDSLAGSPHLQAGEAGQSIESSIERSKPNAHERHGRSKTKLCGSNGKLHGNRERHGAHNLFNRAWSLQAL